MKSLLKISSVIFIYFVLFSGVAMAVTRGGLGQAVEDLQAAKDAHDAVERTIIGGVVSTDVKIRPTTTKLEQEYRDEMEKKLTQAKRFKKFNKEHQHALIMKTSNKVKLIPVKRNRIVNLSQVNR